MWVGTVRGRALDCGAGGAHGLGGESATPVSVWVWVSLKCSLINLSISERSAPFAALFPEYFVARPCLTHLHAFRLPPLTLPVLQLRSVALQHRATDSDRGLIATRRLPRSSGPLRPTDLTEGTESGERTGDPDRLGRPLNRSWDCPAGKPPGRPIDLLYCNVGLPLNSRSCGAWPNTFISNCFRLVTSPNCRCTILNPMFNSSFC